MRGVSHAARSGHIDKVAAAIVAPEVVRPDAIGHVKVEVAVTIVVEPRRTRANANAREGPDQMGDVALGREGHVGENVLSLANLPGKAGPHQ